MSLDERYQSAVKQITSFTKRVSDDELLVVYGLYKQANEGDNNTPQPAGGEEKQKWDAWTSRKGMSKDAAKEEYIAKVAALAPTYT